MCLLAVHNPEALKDRKSRVKEARLKENRGYGTVWVFLCALELTSASRDCLWLTSCLLMGASCCSVLRLLVSARVSRANFVHPAEPGQKDHVYKNGHESGRRILSRSVIDVSHQSSRAGSVLEHERTEDTPSRPMRRP